MLTPSRRGFLIGLGTVLAAPAIVRATSIMRVRPLSLVGGPLPALSSLAPGERLEVISDGTRWQWTNRLRATAPQAALILPGDNYAASPALVLSPSDGAIKRVHDGIRTVELPRGHKKGMTFQISNESQQPLRIDTMGDGAERLAARSAEASRGSFLEGYKRHRAETLVEANALLGTG